jgi:hypothetical protein
MEACDKDRESSLEKWEILTKGQDTLLQELKDVTKIASASNVHQGRLKTSRGRRNEVSKVRREMRLHVKSLKKSITKSRTNLIRQLCRAVKYIQQGQQEEHAEAAGMINIKRSENRPLLVRICGYIVFCVKINNSIKCIYCKSMYFG